MMRFDEKVDWEVELGVVTGSHCYYVDEQDAHEYIAGYCVINDISERAFQLEGTGQWVKAKALIRLGRLGWTIWVSRLRKP
jgi:2-keto-4-pentenoate hydratase/2-oxohepta-3-ene-1,7-dioic acid hydratase in catechol pathway